MSVNCEVTLHGGPLHGQRLELPEEQWQRGEVRIAQLLDPSITVVGGEPTADLSTREVRYTRVTRKPRDFEYVGSL